MQKSFTSSQSLLGNISPKFLLPLSFFIFLNLCLSAQVSTNYVFSQSTGTYSQISGTSVPTLAGALVDDDCAQIAAASIPFTFNFRGTSGNVNLASTIISISPNGWICAGVTTNYGAVPIGFSTNPFGPVSTAVIAAFSADLVGTATSTVEYTTIGVTPNRVFVIQWKNFSEIDQQGASPQNINFQIRLHETTDIIEVVYGSFTNLISTSTIPQVGLRGTTNADYNAREGSGSSNSWSACDPASSNMATIPYLNITSFPYLAGIDYPDPGTTYVWTPGGCSGTPIAGTAGATATSFCSGGSTNLSVTGATSGTGITYLWQTGPSPTGPWTNVATGNPATVSNITTTGYYQCIVTCVNTGLSATTTVPVLITISTAPLMPGLINAPATICAGSTNAFSIAAVSGATTYTWTLPSGWSGSSTGTSINATANSSGGVISVTANNTCGSSSARTLTLVISTAPSTPGTISGANPICAGTTNTYSVTTIPSATSFTWTLPSGWSGTSTTSSIAAISNSSGGLITVTASNTCGTSGSQSLTITVNSVPGTPGTISGPVAVCAGSVNAYSVSPVSGATSFTWTLPVGMSGNSSTGTINATANTGGGTVTVVANNTCGSSAPQSLSVVFNALPVVSFSNTHAAFCTTDPAFLLTGGSPASGTYSGTAVTSGNFSPSTAGVGNFVITYSFTDANNCTNTDTALFAVAFCTGIETVLGDAGISVFPNPFSEKISVRISENAGECNLEIVDLSGKILFENQYKAGSGELILNVPSSWSAGCYFLRVAPTNGNVLMRKLIRQD